MMNAPTERKIVVESTHSTVVANYVSEDGDGVSRSDHYQSEDALEKAFIKQLEMQAYEYLPITNNDDLVNNLRAQIEKLNSFVFSDNEWDNFFMNEISNAGKSVVDKTITIQKDNIKNITLDDGTVKNIMLIDKVNIHNNSLQVISQYETDSGRRSNRYDVTVLVNGLPMIHIELKRRGVAIAEAFNQIKRYSNESFWSDSGLFEYVQIFVISNGTHSKYYSNTIRDSHVKELIKSPHKNKKNSDSFEFTNWWADATNKPIDDLMDFSKTFFAKHTILNILTRYCVFTSKQKLLVLRPYQIAATERILDRIKISSNRNEIGNVDAGGYIWHTTGSGKTLTSFKTAQLASEFIYINKVLFVVDRKDLDAQTMEEYDKYEKGAANGSSSTAHLKRNLEDPSCNITVTTIQKLDRFIKKNKGHKIFNKHVVIIFDECHRSQFGDMHTGITNAFKDYHIFGFTGTPIFAENSNGLRTTEQVFGNSLHTYTIVDAISDKNVLPFKIEHHSTFNLRSGVEDAKVSDIDRESALSSPKRISLIVDYICDHFDQKTKRNRNISSSGFNSIFAVSSIDVAKKYYNEFKNQIKDKPSDKKLKVAIIFSFSPNEDMDENPDNVSGLDASSRDFLDSAINDYNQMFGTSFDTSSDKFRNYYKNVSKNVKDNKIDLLIVVNMFLTGFDAPTLNTLWVDKNLRQHGLLQAFSRTNRIYNSIKSFGNVICFRDLEDATNESLSLFGDKGACGIVLLKTYEEYYNGYEEDGKIHDGYQSLINRLIEEFPVGERIISEESQKEFIKLYGKILKAHNILSTFDSFEGNEILSDRNVQDYHSSYIDLYNDLRTDSDKENINDDLVFEMELIKRIEINIDYILNLIKDLHKDNFKDKDILIDIDKAIASSVEFRNKKDLINQFIKSLNSGSEVDADWNDFISNKKTKDLLIIIKVEKLNDEATRKFMNDAFRNGCISFNGTAISEVLPLTTRFSPDRTKMREIVLSKLNNFFDRYFDISDID